MNPSRPGDDLRFRSRSPGIGVMAQDGGNERWWLDLLSPDAKRQWLEWQRKRARLALEARR